MNQDYYISLIYKSLNGNLAPSEKKDLEKWKSESSENQLIAKSTEKAWALGGNFQTEVEADLDKEYAQLKNKMNKNTKIVKMKQKSPFMKYAAAAVAVIAVAFGANYFLNQEPDNWLTVVASEKQQVELSDGSVVWLNKGAKLEYTPEFGSKRLVKLDGEAFFDVTKDPKKKFVVETENLEIKVLGTSFNVRDTDHEISVFVREGLVNMRAKVYSKGIELKDLDKGFFNKSTKKLTRMLDSKSNDDVWQSGRLVYENDRLMDITNGLQNYYGKEFVLINESIKKCRFTFTFDNKSLQEVMKTLEEVVGFKTEEGEDYVVLEKGACPEVED